MESLKKTIIRQLVLGLLILEVGLLVVMLLGNYFDSKNLSNTISQSVRNNLLVGDFRDSQRAIRSALPESFKYVVFTNSENKTLFKIEGKDPENSFFAFRFEHKISLTDETKLAPSLAFGFPMIPSVWRLVKMGIFLLAGYLLFSFYLYSVIGRYYLRKMEINEKMRVAEVSRQVAHDIKSPLGFLKVYSDTMKGEDDKKIKVLNRAIHRIEKIVNDLEKPVVDLGNSHRININEVVGEIVEEKKVELNNSSVSVDWKIKICKTSCDVAMDGDALKRIISNIINNAFEAMPSGGQITLNLEKNRSNVTLSIQDTGEGIDEGSLNSVFEKGVSSKQSTGLGLYHARETLRLYGASIEIFSEIGKGAKVILTFPGGING